MQFNKRSWWYTTELKCKMWFLCENFKCSFFCLVRFFTSQSTAIVMLRQSVHLTTLLPGQAWLKDQPVLPAHTFAWASQFVVKIVWGIILDVHLPSCQIYARSYMSAHVLLNLSNEAKKSDKMQGLPSFLLLFCNEFNKFNNSRARMLDSIYHMT